MEDLTPREIVAELDKYIVGQGQAKRAVAVALRNRLRRQKVQGDLQDDIIPKNILMIGPTGVGKTEICRRLAKLANAPFAKVEASKFTEVGYVGRDVDSIVRDLVESAVSMVRKENLQSVQDRAEALAEERLLTYCAPCQRSAGRYRIPLKCCSILCSKNSSMTKKTISMRKSGRPAPRDNSSGSIGTGNLRIKRLKLK